MSVDLINIDQYQFKLLYSDKQIETAIRSMASCITDTLKNDNPIIVILMKGGVIPFSLLIKYLAFPLEISYLDVSRYGDHETGSSIIWKKRPDHLFANRTILLIDDILDEGITLHEAINECYGMNALKVYTAVLGQKSKFRPLGIPQCDFFGLTFPDEFLIGCGMDYKQQYRNTKGIYFKSQNES